MPGDALHEADRSFLAGRGIGPELARRQLELLASPPPAIELVRPCTVGDGITRLSQSDFDTFLALHADAARAGRLTKLVPASGAASRMFAPLLAALEAGSPEDATEPPEAVRELIRSLPLFAFHADLAAAARRRGLDLAALAGGRWRELLKLLLSDGLGYATAPKGLIQFHHGPEGARTAFEEHLLEGTAYLADAAGLSRLHFTVPAEALEAFGGALEAVREAIQQQAGGRLEVSFSVQDPATDTLAVDLEGNLLRTAAGEPALRPGGHGALLANLAGLGADVVLIKNIDNILPAASQSLVIRWQRLLVGVLVDLERQAHAHARALESDEVADGQIEEAHEFLARNLGEPRVASPVLASRRARLTRLRDRLSRPMRVCGMVPNEGEPGGGPFWVRDSKGEVHPQIVEASQVGADPAQQAILRSATHFNPVNLACSLKDHRGRAFDLARFVDPATAFVSVKASGGNRIKVLEWPGLWNGAMAGWNTVFVEVPLATFAPVKTVLDLLRPEHRGSQP